MKTSVFAAILLATAFPVLADEDCSNPHATGGNFETKEEAAIPMTQSKPFQHEYLNGGHFEAATEPVDGIDAAFPSRTAMLPAN